MILVIGGHTAGKLDYIRSLGYGEEQIARSLLDERPVSSTAWRSCCGRTQPVERRSCPGCCKKRSLPATR